MKRQILVTSSHMMKQLGSVVASVAKPHDILFLTGEMGSGKTAFAQGFIQKLCNDESMSVPSPTFFLDNTYPVKLPSLMRSGRSHHHHDEQDASSVVVHHMDLYRLGKMTPQNLARLTIPEVFQMNTISLIEWADSLIEYNEHHNQVLHFNRLPILHVTMHYNLEKFSSLLMNKHNSDMDDSEEGGEGDEDRLVTLSTDSDDWTARIDTVWTMMDRLSKHQTQTFGSASDE